MSCIADSWLLGRQVQKTEGAAKYQCQVRGQFLLRLSTDRELNTSSEYDASLGVRRTVTAFKQKISSNFDFFTFPPLDLLKFFDEP
jgi:hypothetical protein